MVSAGGIVHEVFGRDTPIHKFTQVLGNRWPLGGDTRRLSARYTSPRTTPRERTTYHSERKDICVSGPVIKRRRQVCRVQYIMGSTLFQVTVVYGQVKEPLKGVLDGVRCHTELHTVPHSIWRSPNNTCAVRTKYP